MNLFRHFEFRTRLSKYKWYRRWYGGRWERHFIDICIKYIWLSMRPDMKWPEYRQPCSVGDPLIEDYPILGKQLSGNSGELVCNELSKELK